MKHARHGYEKKLKKRKIIFLLLILIILIAIIFYISFKNKQTNENEIVENTIVEENTPEPELEPEPEIEPEVQENIEVVDTSDIPNTYKGYKVLGKIVIDKIGIEQKILSETSMDALKYGVTWFWGPNVNNPRKFVYNRA